MAVEKWDHLTFLSSQATSPEQNGQTKSNLRTTEASQQAALTKRLTEHRVRFTELPQQNTPNEQLPTSDSERSSSNSQSF